MFKIWCLTKIFYSTEPEAVFLVGNLPLYEGNELNLTCKVLERNPPRSPEDAFVFFVDDEQFFLNVSNKLQQKTKITAIKILLTPKPYGNTDRQMLLVRNLKKKDILALTATLNLT